MLLTVALLAALVGSGRPEDPVAAEFSRGTVLRPPLVIVIHPAVIHPECIEAELRSRKLNGYGDPEGTKYPGGAPADLPNLETELPASTLAQLDDQGRAEAARVLYVLQHHPEVEAACSVKQNVMPSDSNPVNAPAK